MVLGRNGFHWNKLTIIDGKPVWQQPDSILFFPCFDPPCMHFQGNMRWTTVAWMLFNLGNTNLTCSHNSLVWITIVRHWFLYCPLRRRNMLHILISLQTDRNSYRQIEYKYSIHWLYFSTTAIEWDMRSTDDEVIIMLFLSTTYKIRDTRSLWRFSCFCEKLFSCVWDLFVLLWLTFSLIRASRDILSVNACGKYRKITLSMHPSRILLSRQIFKMTVFVSAL